MCRFGISLERKLYLTRLREIILFSATLQLFTRPLNCLRDNSVAFDLRRMQIPRTDINPELISNTKSDREVLYVFASRLLSTYQRAVIFFTPVGLNPNVHRYTLCNIYVRQLPVNKSNRF